MTLSTTASGQVFPVVLRKTHNFRCQFADSRAEPARYGGPMRAVVYRSPGELPRLTRIAHPACPPDGVLIEVGATGVCRSDWHAWMGHDAVPLPMVPGHEFAGTVVEVGGEVRNWRGGERVTVPFACGCGRCRTCASGQTHICPHQSQPGFTHWGSFADLVAVHAADTNLVALPDQLDFLTAASLGCRFATAHRALHQARLEAADTVLIHGAGGVGLSTVMIATALDLRPLVTDPSPDALARASQLGAQPLTPDDFARLRQRPLDHPAIAAVIDAIGAPGLVEASADVLAPGGRHVQVGLLFGDVARQPAPMGALIARELEIIGSHGMPARDYPPLLDLITSGRLHPEDLIGRVIPLADAGRALSDLDASTGSGMTLVTIAES